MSQILILILWGTAGGEKIAKQNPCPYSLRIQTINGVNAKDHNVREKLRGKLLPRKMISAKRPEVTLPVLEMRGDSKGLSSG